MSGKDNWQMMLKENRLQHQLEIQSRQIEQVLTEHEMAGQVAGGQVHPRTIRFDLQAQFEQGWDRLRMLKQDLLGALRVTHVELVQEGGQWRLHVTRPEEPPVCLLDVLPVLPELPPVTAVLGIQENGQPLLMQFEAGSLTNMLIGGMVGAGKTALLRTIALSLALNNRQAQLQLLVIDGEAIRRGVFSELEPLSYLPHMLTPVACTMAEAEELLALAVGELTYRQEQQIQAPTIVLLMDDLAPLLLESVVAAEALQLLALRGAQSGIHLVGTVERPQALAEERIFLANFPVRMVGALPNVQESAVMSEMSDCRADYLLGAGDFLAVVHEQVSHFQVAYIGEYDLHLTLESLHRNRPTPLVAQTFSVRPTAVPYAVRPDVDGLGFTASASGELRLQ
jgi:DNA segregation ATPase FtsK/SpoIIIE-like protein